MPIAIRGSGEPARPSAAVRLSSLPWCMAATICSRCVGKTVVQFRRHNRDSPIAKISDKIARLAALQARNTAVKDYSGAAGHLQALTVKRREKLTQFFDPGGGSFALSSRRNQRDESNASIMSAGGERARYRAMARGR